MNRHYYELPVHLKVQLLVIMREGRFREHYQGGGYMARRLREWVEEESTPRRDKRLLWGAGVVR